MPDDTRSDDTANDSQTDSPPGAATSQQRWDDDTFDALLALLIEARRRYVLSYLTDRPDDPVDVDDLEAAILAQEQPRPGRVSHRDRVRIDLHHVHLPKLADAGVIEYDPVDSSVQYTGPDELADLLEATATLEADEDQEP